MRPEPGTPARYAVTGTVFDGARLLPGHAVEVAEGLIRSCCPQDSLPPDITRFDARGGVIAPGFVDLQVNGCGGVMFNGAVSSATLETMRAANLTSGCLAFLPTLITTDDAEMLAAMDLVEEYRKEHGPLPVLGLHLEGPYINASRRGIHDASHIRPLDQAMLDALTAYARRVPLLLTLAPECVSPEAVRALARAGAVVSLGHSAASYEQAMLAVDAGARAATHLFNGMEPLRGREPGLLGAVFDSPGLACGLIADGHHVHFASLNLAKRLKGEMCFLVTDATAPAGAEMAGFSFCGQPVYVKDGKAVNADGTLGGSLLTMIRAVENSVVRAGWPLEEALRMASLYPARLMDQDGLLGRLAPGGPASFVVFQPATFALTAAVDRGVPHFFA